MAGKYEKCILGCQKTRWPSGKFLFAYEKTWFNYQSAGKNRFEWVANEVFQGLSDVTGGAILAGKYVLAGKFELNGLGNGAGSTNESIA